jgi:hypothetical protein
MSTDNERCLTADGRVLACLLDHRRVYKGRFTHRNAYNTTIAGLQWTNSEPFRWDATCVRCRGRGTYFKGQMDNDLSPCPTCKGTGVDERIPLHLVGVGSELEAIRDTPDGLRAGRRLLVTHVGDLWWYAIPLDRTADPSFCRLMPVDFGATYEVVRPVPPALARLISNADTDTEDTP